MLSFDQTTIRSFHSIKTAFLISTKILKYLIRIRRRIKKWSFKHQNIFSINHKNNIRLIEIISYDQNEMFVNRLKYIFIWKK